MVEVTHVPWVIKRRGETSPPWSFRSPDCGFWRQIEVCLSGGCGELIVNSMAEPAVSMGERPDFR